MRSSLEGWKEKSSSYEKENEALRIEAQNTSGDLESCLQEAHNKELA